MRRPERGSRGMWAVLLGVIITGVSVPAAPASAAVEPAAPAPAATSWSVSPSPSPAAPARGRLQGVTCLSPSNCFAAGFYQEHYRGRTLPLVGRWTGTTWAIVPAPFPAGGTEDATATLLDVACASPTRCFAVGNYYDGIESFSMIIEQWNGTAWSVALAATPPGLQFSALGGVSCRNRTTCFAVGLADDGTQSIPLVERWNGTSWSQVPSPSPAGGSGGSLTDVSCASSTACLAVGQFTSNTTHRSQTLVERWNGRAWSVVASPNAPGVNYGRLGSVSCPTPKRCFAAGVTQTGTGPFTSRTLIERWDGRAWSIVASPNVPNADDNRLSGISCASPSNCTAVGSSIDDLNDENLASRSLVERWNGTAWSIVAAPNPGTTGFLSGVSCPAARSCIAVGKYEINFHELALIDRWDGRSWSVVAEGGSDSRLRRVSCTSPTNCFAVGDAFDGFTGNNLIERWNGTRWAVVAGPDPSEHASRLNGISCVTATMCMAVGQFDTTPTNPFAAPPTTPFVERWDGSTWSTVPSPDPGTVTSSLQSVACPTAVTCFAVGTAGDGSTSKTLIERWNGSSWSIVASPNGADYNNVLSGIACPTATSCFAVGTTDNSGYSSKTLVERWNGTSWSIVASPNSSDDFTELNDVTCTSATNCFAVGGSQTFFLDDGNTIIERWNGTTWSIVPGPEAFGNRVLSGVACASATSCTAVGSAVHGVLSTETVAETWNGTSWSIVATPNPAEAYANQLFGVACRDTGLCFAVGSATSDLGTSTLVARNS